MSDALGARVLPNISRVSHARAQRLFPDLELPARVRFAAWYVEFTGAMGLLLVAVVLRLLGTSAVAIEAISVLARVAGQGGSLDPIVIGVIGAVAMLSAWRDLR